MTPKIRKKIRDAHAAMGNFWVATPPFFGIGRSCIPGRERGDRPPPSYSGARLPIGLTPALRTSLAFTLAVLVVLIGIPAATSVARGSGVKDPQFVVIDEVAGQLIALIACPLWMENFSGGFYTFSRIRYPQASAGAATGSASGRNWYRAGRRRGGIVRAWLVMHLLLHFGLLTVELLIAT